MMQTGWIAELLRLVRFSMVGVVATIVYIVAAMIAVEWFKTSSLVGGTIGFCASFLISYIGHFHFTFAAPGRYRDYVVKFGISSAVAFLVSTLTMWLTTSVLKIDYRAALLTIAIVIPACSYLGSRFWVFWQPSRPTAGHL